MREEVCEQAESGGPLQGSRGRQEAQMQYLQLLINAEGIPHTTHEDPLRFVCQIDKVKCTMKGVSGFA